MKQIFLLLLFPSWLLAQQLPDSLEQKVDQLFNTYTDKTPGCAVAIVKNGAVIFEKGYGLANLEYKIPVQPTTPFHIASESKQFVAFSILLLEQQGKLKLDDDIRIHLKELPDFGRTITIRQLIYHTSGLRDQWQLLAIGGWQLDDVITRDHVLKLVSQQRALNFNPGDQYMYCNTGYTLLGEIVKTCSGLSLRRFAETFIFKPLGMKDTHFHDNYKELVPERAYSYARIPGGYQHEVLSYSIVGATSLITTVQDEAKWLSNFATGAVGGKDLISKMHEAGVLNNGLKLNYAFALGLDKYKGWDQIGHGGADAGFRSYACRFPEQDLGIIVFSNLAQSGVRNHAVSIADLFIKDKKEEPKAVVHSRFEDSAFHKKFVGSYYTEAGDLVKIQWKNGKLYRNLPQTINQRELKFAAGINHHYPLVDTDAEMILESGQANRDSILQFTILNAYNHNIFKRQPVQNFENREFIGRFYSPELETFYNLVEENGKLQLQHRRYNTVSLNHIAPDQFTSPNWWISHIRFLRNKKGKVIAFEINAGRVQHLRFEKVQ